MRNLSFPYNLSSRWTVSPRLFGMTQMTGQCHLISHPQRRIPPESLEYQQKMTKSGHRKTKTDLFSLSVGFFLRQWAFIRTASFHKAGSARAQSASSTRWLRWACGWWRRFDNILLSVNTMYLPQLWQSQGQRPLRPCPPRQRWPHALGTCS